jgi:hypothetical protein
MLEAVKVIGILVAGTVSIRARDRESALTQRPLCLATISEIGAPGFEPGASWSQTRRATGLRYAPLATASTNLAMLPCSSNRPYPARRSNTSMSARMARPRCEIRCFAASGASPNPICKSSDQNSGS